MLGAVVLLATVLGTAVAVSGTAHADVFPSPNSTKLIAVDPSAVAIGTVTNGTTEDADTFYLAVELAGGRGWDGPCAGGGGPNGSQVEIMPCSPFDYNLRWFFKKTNVTGLYEIHSAGWSRCLDEDNSRGGGNYTKVQVWDCHGPWQLNQYWWAVGTQNNGFMQLVNDWSGRCLTIDDNPTFRAGSPAVTWDCGDRPHWNNQWFYAYAPPPLPLNE